MAKNDRLLLDGIIDDRISLRLPSEKRDEAFEHLAFEQILKDYDLSTDEILEGTIDGRGDGGIDGFFVLINGHLLQDPESFHWPRTNSELKLILVTAKHHDTFRQATLDSLIATITELLDFGVDDNVLAGAYSEALLRMRNNLMFAYRKLSPRLSSFSASIYYASRGDASELGEEVKSRGRQVVSIFEECFGSCKADFSFVGATELIELHRKIRNYTLELPFVEALAKGERYVILARLSDYFKFVTDGTNLRRYLFESNVRDFMGLNRVNEDIKATLEDPDSVDFWWLNNGITILATSAAITGKSIQASDIQIVNGLQTTESIYRHFISNTVVTDDRCVLVKVIVTQDDKVRDAIIRATNNQTNVELSSLHATDKIQRDIEDILLRHGLYYERRKNFYANQGHPPTEIVTPLAAAAGYVALALKLPHKATTLRSKFMRNPNSYETIFNGSEPLEVWAKIIHILNRVDLELEILRPKSTATDKFLKGLRYITAFCLVSKHFGTFAYAPVNLANIDPSIVTTTEVEAIWQILTRISSPYARYGGWSSTQNMLKACKELSRTYGIKNFNALPVNRSFNDYWQQKRRPIKEITQVFIDQVRSLLPKQPWKPGVHRAICKELNCDNAEYFAAVERLFEDGVFLRQRDGVLFDAEGNVVSFDPERVDPNSLELRTPNA